MSVDSESGFSDTVEGLDATVALLDSTGAAGISIEDYVPGRGILGIDEATERVARFVAASDGTGMVVTARAENHLYGHDDLDDTIARLRSFAGAGAHCVYAPGLHTAADIARVVAEAGAPVNVLALRDGPGVSELTELGVRRVSIGGAVAFAAYGAAERAARELLEQGTMDFATGVLSPEQRTTRLRRYPAGLGRDHLDRDPVEDRVTGDRVHLTGGQTVAVDPGSGGGDRHLRPVPVVAPPMGQAHHAGHDVVGHLDGSDHRPGRR